jgi:hypothetical protein
MPSQSVNTVPAREKNPHRPPGVSLSALNHESPSIATEQSVSSPPHDPTPMDEEQSVVNQAEDSASKPDEVNAPRKKRFWSKLNPFRKKPQNTQ